MLANKKIFWLVLILVSILCFLLSQGFVFCEEKTIAVLVPNGADPYFQAKWYGYQDEASKLGYKALFYDAGGYQFVEKQIKQLNDVVLKGVDGIILTSCSYNGLVSATDNAVESGIPVLVDNVDVNSKLVKARVMRTNAQMARYMAMDLIREMKGEGKIIMLAGPSGASMPMEMTEAALKQFSWWPEIEVVAVEYTPSDMAMGMKAMEDLLVAHPDVNGVYAWGCLICPGAVRAIQKAGYSPGEIKVTSFNIDVGVEDLIKQGWVTSCVVTFHVDMARLSVKTLDKMIKGEDVPEMQYASNVVVNIDDIDKFDRAGITVPEGWIK